MLFSAGTGRASTRSLNIAAGLCAPKAGHIIVDGEPIALSGPAVGRNSGHGSLKLPTWRRLKFPKLEQKWEEHVSVETWKSHQYTEIPTTAGVEISPREPGFRRDCRSSASSSSLAGTARQILRS